MSEPGEIKVNLNKVISGRYSEGEPEGRVNTNTLMRNREGVAGKSKTLEQTGQDGDG